MISVKFDWNNSLKKGIITTELLDVIREHFSVVNTIAKIRKFDHHLPARLYGITPTGRFEIGLFKEIYEHIKSLQVPVNIEVTPAFRKRFKPSYNFSKISELNKTPHEYQREALETCLKQGWGTVMIATAGGKTLVMATLIQTVIDNTEDNYTLVVVPSIQLVEQTYKDFIDYGMDESRMTKWSGKNERVEGCSLIIASLPILQSKKTDLSLLGAIDLFIIDEAHSLRKANKVNKLVKQISTPHKFAFTGTMPDEKIDYWNVIGTIGPLVAERTSSQLRESKHIADCIIKILALSYLDTPKCDEAASISNPTVEYNAELDFIFMNRFRNHIIAKTCSKLKKNTLITVDRIIHGEELYRIVKRTCPNHQVYFIQGSMDTDEREKIRALMENDDNIICIAMSRIFSTGINIKNLHYIILANAGKAKIRLLQSIGRGLRLHENKQMLIILDIADNLKYGIDHLRDRLSLYISEKYNYEITRFQEGKDNKGSKNTS